MLHSVSWRSNSTVDEMTRMSTLQDQLQTACHSKNEVDGKKLSGSVDRLTEFFCQETCLMQVLPVDQIQRFDQLIHDMTSRNAEMIQLLLPTVREDR
eukprot:749418-Hanusia_phi.AAC.3